MCLRCGFCVVFMCFPWGDCCFALNLGLVFRVLVLCLLGDIVVVWLVLIVFWGLLDLF